MRWRSVLTNGLVAEFAPRLARFFASLGADPRTAEDLTQEVFLRLIRTEAAYEERGKVASYLFRIAYRIWVDETRVRRPAPLDPEETLLQRDRRMDLSEAPLDLCLHHEAEDRLREALRQLPQGQRAAFELGVLQGVRYREIAEILQVPLGTVKSRIFTAAKTLKNLLQEKEERV